MKEKLSKGVILSLAGGDLYCKQFQLSAFLWATSNGGGGGGGGRDVVVLFSPFWGFLFICTQRCLFSRFIWYLFFSFQRGRQCRRASGGVVQCCSFSWKKISCPASSLGVGRGNKLSAVPFSAFQASGASPHFPLYSSDPPSSLPPSLSIDVGSHTCHLSLLIMHGRCCWCGLSHWDWERQEWQHCAA